MSEVDKPVGILAVQGDFAMHALMLDRIGAPWRLVKHVEDLDEVSGLIMPGGESTTMLKFFDGEGMGEAVKRFAQSGRPVFGTCAGAILLAREVTGPAQESLDLLDITVERNGYGRQVDSSVRAGNCPELSPRPVEMVFIRAPIIRRVGVGVRVVGECGGLPVMVEQGNVLAATFHPELTEDGTVHRYFLSKLSGGPVAPLPRILFVCVGNACRSQMAEALANHFGKGRMQAWSAGSRPSGWIASETETVLQEKGIGLEGSRSKGLADVPVAEMDVVVKMGYDVAFSPPPGFKGKVIEWDMPDPYGHAVDFFRDLRDLIETEVKSLLVSLDQPCAQSVSREG